MRRRILPKRAPKDEVIGSVGRWQEGLKDPYLGGVLEAEGDGHLGQRDPASHLSDPYQSQAGPRAACPAPPSRCPLKHRDGKHERGAVTYLRPGERELQRGCGRRGFYRPPCNPTGSFLLYIWKESDRHHKLRSSSFLTFFGRCQGKGIYRNEQGP